MAGQFMERAANRDYTKWWQKEGTFPWLMQQKKEELTGRPGSVKDNYIKCVKGMGPDWMPIYGMESNTIWPDAMEECNVPEVEGFDWWGVHWIGSGSSVGMITKPGTRTISSFDKWKEELEWPDLSVVDFKTDGEKIVTRVDPDRVHIYECVKGLFERLHELIPFEESLMAFYEEPELLEEFFEKMADYKIESCSKIFENYGRVDGICYHDDWGTQRAGFFKIEMLRSQIMPQTKRFFDFVHEQGKFIELHSCGRNMDYVPTMLDMGVDHWTPQRGVNDMDWLYENYGKEMTFTIPLNVAANLSDSEIEKITHEFVDKYAETKRVMAWIFPENRADMDRISKEIVDYSYKVYNTI